MEVKGAKIIISKTLSFLLIFCGILMGLSCTLHLENQVSSCYAVGWIGGGNDGWQTGDYYTYDTYGYKSFFCPEGVCVDGSGNIFIADTLNYRISKWDSAGNAIGWIGGGYDGWQTSNTSGYGITYKYFRYPCDVCIDNSGNIYVADVDAGKICKWDSAGNAVGWIGGGVDGWQTNDYVNSMDYRSFYGPHGVAVDSSGNIYVADKCNHRISKWDSAGNAVGWIGGGKNGWQTNEITASLIGSNYQSFYYPSCVCIDQAGNIYVADTCNQRISKWDSAGNAVGWIGCGYNGWQKISCPGYSGYGTGNKYFFDPIDVFVDSDGVIYVSDSGNRRICRWSADGVALGWIGGGYDGWHTRQITSGDGIRYFKFPSGLYLDQMGYIYIADIFNYRISKWHK